MAVTDLRAAARDHLWLHFTRMHGYEAPVIVRGEGCYLWDDNGKRYLDALAGLFSVNIGYFRTARRSARRRSPRCASCPSTRTGRTRIRARSELRRRACLGPRPRTSTARSSVSGGSEAVESAWKLARQSPHGERQKRRWKAVSRRTAYHGTTMGALSINGIAALRAPFEPLVPDVVHVRNTNRYHRPADETEEEFTAYLLEDLESSIEQAGPETVAMVIFEPVQNAGGSVTPPAGYFLGVCAICDRYGSSSAPTRTFTAFGRTGAWFASEKYDIKPDLITCAKGLSSSYAAIGAVLVADKVYDAFNTGTEIFSHGITFGGHPVGCAIALKNLEIMERDGIVTGAAEHEAAFRAQLATLLELDIVGDLRGTGYLWALELVKNKETRETFTDEESETLLRGFLSPELFDKGLICRADDRGDPVVQISPPLVAREEEFGKIVGILGEVLTEAWKRIS